MRLLQNFFERMLADGVVVPKPSGNSVDPNDPRGRKLWAEDMASAFVSDTGSVLTKKVGPEFKDPGHYEGHASGQGDEVEADVSFSMSVEASWEEILRYAIKSNSDLTDEVRFDPRALAKELARDKAAQKDVAKQLKIDGYLTANEIYWEIDLKAFEANLAEAIEKGAEDADIYYVDWEYPDTDLDDADKYNDEIILKGHGIEFFLIFWYRVPKKEKRGRWAAWSMLPGRTKRAEDLTQAEIVNHPELKALPKVWERKLKKLDRDVDPYAGPGTIPLDEALQNLRFDVEYLKTVAWDLGKVYRKYTGRMP